MAYVRARDSGKPLNGLELGPLHDELMEYTKRISDDPSSIILSEAIEDYSLLPKTFDGCPVDRPDVLNAVYSRVPDLPYLTQIVKAFFRGAHDKLINFTEEYQPDGLIASLSYEERASAFVETTNDCNEGALGGMRQLKARMPNLSLQGLNARMMLYHNNLIEYYAQTSADEKKLMRANARTYLSSRQEQRRRVAHAEFREKRAHEHAQQIIEKKQKKDEDARKLADRLRAVKVVTDEKEISKMTHALCTLQLEWHRQFRGVNEKGRHTILLMSGKKITEKQEYLKKVVKEYLEQVAGDTGNCSKDTQNIDENTKKPDETPMVPMGDGYDSGFANNSPGTQCRRG
jgi:hypothetical protein